MFFAGLILFAFCVLVFSYGLGQVSFNFMEFLVRNLSVFVFFCEFSRIFVRFAWFFCFYWCDARLVDRVRGRAEPIKRTNFRLKIEDFRIDFRPILTQKSGVRGTVFVRKSVSFAPARMCERRFRSFFCAIVAQEPRKSYLHRMRPSSS